MNKHIRAERDMGKQEKMHARSHDESSEDVQDDARKAEKREGGEAKSKDHPRRKRGIYHLIL